GQRRATALNAGWNLTRDSRQRTQRPRLYLLRGRERIAAPQDRRLFLFTRVKPIVGNSRGGRDRLHIGSPAVIDRQSERLVAFQLPPEPLQAFACHAVETEILRCVTQVARRNPLFGDSLPLQERPRLLEVAAILRTFLFSRTHLFQGILPLGRIKFLFSQPI